MRLGFLDMPFVTTKSLPWMAVAVPDPPRGVRCQRTPGVLPGIVDIKGRRAASDHVELAVEDRDAGPSVVVGGRPSGVPRVGGRVVSIELTGGLGLAVSRITRPVKLGADTGEHVELAVNDPGDAFGGRLR